MADTHEYVEKLNEKQRKDEHNKSRQGKNRNPGRRSPSKTHK